MRFFHLSFRYKIPLWGGVLIVISVLAVSATLMLKAYEDLKGGVHISAGTLVEHSHQDPVCPAATGRCLS